MLHREAERGDELGNPETLVDQDGGIKPVVRGVHWLSFGRRVHGSRARRSLAARLYHTPLLAFGAANYVKAVAAPTWSMLAADVPEGVDVLKVGVRGDGRVEVRAAHAFEEAEDPSLSTPATLDLATFTGLGWRACGDPVALGTPPSAACRRPVRRATPLSPLGTPPRRRAHPALRRGELIFNYANATSPLPHPPPVAPLPPPARPSAGRLNEAAVNGLVVTLAPMQVASVAVEVVE